MCLWHASPESPGDYIRDIMLDSGSDGAGPAQATCMYMKLRACNLLDYDLPADAACRPATRQKPVPPLVAAFPHDAEATAG